MINRLACDRLMNFSELVEKTAGLIEQRKNNPPIDALKQTYFEELDRRIGGLEAGKVTAVVGRPSMGKTMLALNIVRNMVVTGTRVLVVSLSVSKEDWTQFFLCSSANIDLHKTRMGHLNAEELARLTQSVQKNSSLPLYVVDDVRHLEDVIKTITQLIQEHNIGLVLIDGLSDIYGITLRSIKERGIRYEKQLKTLKEKTAQWNVPVMVTQTLSRRFELNPYAFVSKYEYGPKEGNLYQNVHKILHIYREEYYCPKKHNKGQMDIRIPAMKFGDWNSSARLYFERSTGLIKEYTSTPFDPDSV